MINWLSTTTTNGSPAEPQSTLMQCILHFHLQHCDSSVAKFLGGTKHYEKPIVQVAKIISDHISLIAEESTEWKIDFHGENYVSQSFYVFPIILSFVDFRLPKILAPSLQMALPKL